ncbi:NAD-dependent epimerase/dehydratase family protein [Adonisia turfae]|uniref:NAD-dependent epimerase/dehydratase family protein n=1 Tax=Adonisia turfae CCMR0081 TaxID=2292702 RepID=A0A6M0RI29_9CYAN|nr:NAD-dependent epimerase/dehydratase family protein [Adonisia turfae]NEZ55291.1 NAD-dependent epimerase/dehydratase family protein [Adonisia turfae CCMR0081]
MIHTFLRGQRVLITGVSGFLGLALCDQLTIAGAHVTGIDIDPPAASNSAYGRWLKLPHQFVQLDLLTPQLGEFLADQRFDTIFHLAGMANASGSIIWPTQDFSQNLVATVHLLDALRNCEFRGRFIFASSAAVYGEPPTHRITEETPVRPISPYGVSKLAAEEYIRVYSDLYGFEAAIARIFSIYGPRQKKQVVFDILHRTLLSDEPISLFGSGREVRDFIHVEDATRALATLTSQTKIGAPIFNVCSGNGTAIRDLAYLIVTMAHQSIERVTFKGNKRGGDPSHWVGCNKALLRTGYTAEYSLFTGLQATLNWFNQWRHQTSKGTTKSVVKLANALK